MRNSFTLLTRHGHPVSPADQFAYLLHGVKEHPDFSMATQIYLTMQPTVALRRFDGLAKALIDAHPSSAPSRDISLSTLKNCVGNVTLG
jgi:hypothetical protein